jgi:hypothetical protein
MQKKEWSQGRGAIALNEVQCVAAIRKLIKYLVDAASFIHVKKKSSRHQDHY